MAKAPEMYGCSFQPYPYLRCYARDWEAQKRYGQLCSVDKTNVLGVSQLWRGLPDGTAVRSNVKRRLTAIALRDDRAMAVQLNTLI